MIAGLVWAGPPHSLLLRGIERRDLVLVTSPHLLAELGDTLALPRFRKRILDAATSREKLLEVYRDTTISPARGPPTDWGRSMTTVTSFRRRPTSCSRSTSTASDRCRMRGHTKAARWPNSERLRANAGKISRHGGGRRSGCRCFEPENGGHAIHEPLVSPEIVAERPLAGLSFGHGTITDHQAPG